MRAWLALRNESHYRRDSFERGLKACDYEVRNGVTMHPGPRDILVIWNRYGENDRAAKMFERFQRPVIVAENALWGNDFAGERWFSLALGHHNTAGRFPIGGPERWASINTRLSPWRDGGKEIVILPQRGIGVAGVAMPHGWADRVKADCGGRVRRHPGKTERTSLRDDLANARMVRTWGSGAAVKALLWGIPVKSDMPGWIAAQDNTDDGRLAMFEQLAWATWRIEEIASGKPLARMVEAA